MGPNLLLLLFLGLAGQGSAGSLPEVLQAPVGSSILVQCHYRLQDVKARKVWCRFLPEGCQPLVSSAVDRRAPASSRIFLTDLGGGLLQVEMVTLQEEDAGEYGCVVEGISGPQTVHRISLDVLPAAPGLKEEDEETHQVGSLADISSSDPVGSASPLDPSRDKKRPLIWGAVLLLGLLVLAVVLFAVMAKRKGNRLSACGRFQSSGVSGSAPSSVVHHISDSGLAADLPSDVPYVRLDSPPSFDNNTYTNLPLDSLSGNQINPPPAPSCLPPLPAKAEICSKPVTYATVTFPGGDKSGGASFEPAQDPPNSEIPPS
ncbi:trem-like transcript 1 protein isoform X2 [Sagmatias obliquidens]|uniref:trem-like transcript 1 protein isoform X2 n=1 Tax=Sagmatias obliquidens TaxID=3371155 RepID=UPI000F44600B|nr:trem-like transcript 1 protein isoform X2 [Lagenorhynchus obliquidens]